MISLSFCPAIWTQKAVKNAVARYEKIAGVKINFDKSEGLQLGALEGVAFPLPVMDPSASSRCGSGPGSNWNEIGRKVLVKVNAKMGTWLRKRLSLKSRA